jgi:hypothetical protein
LRSDGEGDFFGDGGGERGAELFELVDYSDDRGFGFEYFLLLSVD